MLKNPLTKSHTFKCLTYANTESLLPTETYLTQHNLKNNNLGSLEIYLKIRMGIQKWKKKTVAKTSCYSGGTSCYGTKHMKRLIVFTYTYAN